MMLEFDTLKSEYIDKILEISSKNIPCGWSKQAYIAELNKDNSLYCVALYNGEVAGFIGVQYVLDTADITNIAVDDSYKRQGIATMLLNKMFELCKNHSVSIVELEVRETNQAAHSLYQKMGFEKCGIRKNYYSDTGEAAILMTKQI